MEISTQAIAFCCNLCNNYANDDQASSTKILASYIKRDSIGCKSMISWKSENKSYSYSIIIYFENFFFFPIVPPHILSQNIAHSGCNPSNFRVSLWPKVGSGINVAGTDVVAEVGLGYSWGKGATTLQKLGVHYFPTQFQWCNYGASVPAPRNCGAQAKMVQKSLFSSHITRTVIETPTRS